jgi:FkbM family methyltransferase
MSKLIRALTVLVAVFTLVSLGFTRIRAAGAAAFGSCSYGQIMAGERVLEQFPQVQAGIKEHSYKLQDDGGFQRWSTPQGEFWYFGAPSRLDFFVLAEEESDLYRTERIKPGDIVIDCGANYGTFTRRALRRGAAKVVAIEIDPNIQESLRRTFASEIREGRVIVYGKGVWDKDAELDLRGDSVVLERGGSARLVPVTTIDKIVADLKLPKVDFIKMDIEGAEKNALRGGRETLAKYVPNLALSTEHLPDDMERIPELVSQLVPGRYRKENGYCYFDKIFRATPNVIDFSR